jgi:hypothetical protein
MVYDLFRALSGDRAFCHRRLRTSRKLRASVEALKPHGFVVRDRHVRLARHRVHRIPHPTFVTIAKRPSWRARDGRRETTDLPDVTSEMVCDKLTRRANQHPPASMPVKDFFVTQGQQYRAE